MDSPGSRLGRRLSSAVMLSQLSNDLLLLGSSLVGSPLKTTAAPDLRAALGGAEVGTLGEAASAFEGAAAAAELEEGVLD